MSDPSAVSTPQTRSGYILMAGNTYVPDDPRIIFAAESLQNMGYTVTLIGAARQRDGTVQVLQHIRGVNTIITPQMRSHHIVELARQMWQVITGRLPPTTVAHARYRTSRMSFLLFNLWVLRIGLGVPVDVVHCHDLSPLPGSWLLARLKRARLIYDAHENAPTIYGGRKGAFIARLERWLLPRANVVISAGMRLQQALEQRGARKVVHIGNWKRLDDYAVTREDIEAIRDELQIDDDDLVIVYIGTIDPSREIYPLLDAIKESPDVHLVIGGAGQLVDDVIEAAKHYPNIHWLRWVDVNRVPLYTTLADSLYCCLDVSTYTEKNYFAPAANKLFEGFAAGVPLIARRGVNEMGDILEDVGSGILLDEVTPESVCGAFQKLRDPLIAQNLRANALTARNQYNWGMAEQRLAQIYAELLSQTS